MKLKDLIRLHLTGELGALQHTIESLLEIELTLCSQQTLDGLSDLFCRVSEACEDLDSYVEDAHIDLIIAQYGGEVYDWVEINAIDSSVGNDYWYRNVETNQEVYVNVDQDNVTMELCRE